MLPLLPLVARLCRSEVFDFGCGLRANAELQGGPARRGWSYGGMVDPVVEGAGVGGDGDVGGTLVGCGVVVGGTDFDGVAGEAGLRVVAGGGPAGAGAGQCCRVAGGAL